MADPVGHDDEVFRRIEQAACAHQDLWKLAPCEAGALSPGSVKKKHRIECVTRRITAQRSGREIMDVKVRQNLAGVEAEIGDLERAVRGAQCWRGRRLRMAHG